MSTHMAAVFRVLPNSLTFGVRTFMAVKAILDAFPKDIVEWIIEKSIDNVTDDTHHFCSITRSSRCIHSSMKR